MAESDSTRARSPVRLALTHERPPCASLKAWTAVPIARSKAALRALSAFIAKWSARVQIEPNGR